MNQTELQAEITWLDPNHRIAVIVFEGDGDAIMLPLDLLPEGLTPGQKIRVTIEMQ